MYKRWVETYQHITENYNYYLKHDENFLKSFNLKFFNYNILDYDVNKENHFIFNILKSSPKNSILLDIGAYRGDTCINISRLLKQNNRSDVKILAFEPNKEHVNYMNRIINEEKLNIKIYEIVISSKKDVIIKKSNEGAGTMYGFHFENNENGTKFKTNTLDNILQQENINDVFFVKIDVEGHEPDVLEGSINTLQNIKHLYIEMWNDKHAYTRLLKNSNYSHNKSISKYLQDFFPIQKIEKNIYFKHKSLLKNSIK